MIDVYLGLGSNLGDRIGHLDAALQAIAALPGTELVQQSPVYETPPMGPQDQDAYLNQAAHIRTTLEPVALIEASQAIERETGRADPERRRHWGPREIDIDVLLFDDRVIDMPDLKVPHPGMAERWFVLRPLADLAPDALHPLLNKSVFAMLTELEQAGVPRGVAV